MPKSPAAFGGGPGGARAVPADVPAPVAVAPAAVHPVVAALPPAVAPAQALRPVPVASAPAAVAVPVVAVPASVARPRVLSGVPAVRRVVVASRSARVVKYEQMQAPTIGGVRVRKGDGETVRLPRGASLTDFAERIGVDAAALVQMLFSLGEMVTATESVNDETFELLGEGSTTTSRSSRPRTRTASCSSPSTWSSAPTRAPRPTSRRVRRSSRSWVTSTTERPSCSTRCAAQRGRQGGRWHHPAHRCLPGLHRRRRRGPPDHLHRHPGSRGVHRHACPWCAGHRHRGAGGRGRRRRDAADGRGVEPRQGRRRADRGRGEQDRQARLRPDQGPGPADRVRPRARGVRRRHHVRRRLGQVRAQPRQAARGDRADRRCVAGPAGQPGAGRPGPRGRGAPRPRSWSGGHDPGAARHAARRRVHRGGTGLRSSPRDARRARRVRGGGRPVASGDGARSDRRSRRGPELHRRGRRPDGAPDRREA